MNFNKIQSIKLDGKELRNVQALQISVNFNDTNDQEQNKITIYRFVNGKPRLESVALEDVEFA